MCGCEPNKGVVCGYHRNPLGTGDRMETTYWCWRNQMDDPELASDAIYDHYEGDPPAVRILEVEPTGNVSEDWEGPGFRPAPILEMRVVWEES